MSATIIGKKARTMSLSHMAAAGSSATDVRLVEGASTEPASGRGSAKCLRVAGAASNAMQCRRGAAATEFALVLPVLLGLLFGTFEYGLAFFSFNAMQNATRDVGRQVSINTLLVANAEGAIRTRLPAWTRDTATVSVQQSTPANPNTNVYTFVVSMPMSGATPIQFFSRVANPTLRTELRLKQELPYVANP